MNKPDKPIVIAVLGISRSGTSVATNLIGACGAYLGEGKDLRGGTDRNPKGYFEHLEVMRINRALIRESGFAHGRDLFSSSYGGTFKGLSLNPIRSYKFKYYRKRTLSSMQKFVDKMNKHGTWAFKTNSTTFRIWKRFLPNLKVVATYRHPLSNAASHMLSSRETVSFNRIIRDWTDINKEILYDISTNNTIVIKYEDLFSKTDQVLDGLINFVGQGKKEDLRAIVEPKLNRAEPYIEKLKDVYPLSLETKEVLAALDYFSQNN